MDAPKWIEGDLPSPTQRKGEGQWQRCAAALRERPGVWAELERFDAATEAYQAQAHLTRYVGPRLGGGEWHFAVRKNGDGTRVLYGRFVGST